jgi:hypothetical protein
MTPGAIRIALGVLVLLEFTRKRTSIGLPCRTTFEAA